MKFSIKDDKDSLVIENAQIKIVFDKELFDEKGSCKFTLVYDLSKDEREKNKKFITIFDKTEKTLETPMPNVTKVVRSLESIKQSTIKT